MKWTNRLGLVILASVAVLALARACGAEILPMYSCHEAQAAARDSASFGVLAVIGAILWLL